MAAGHIHPILNFGVTPKDELCGCPYNKSHLVLKPRLSQHLVKCRDAYEKDCKKKKVIPSILICRWNTNHHMDTQLLTAHESECPDRAGVIEQAISYNDPAFKIPGPQASPVVQNFSSSIDEECWEPVVFSEVRMKIPESTLEENVRNNVEPKVIRPAYDPAKKLMSEPIIVNPQGLTRSERKQYRLEERKRWNDLNLMQRLLNPDIETIEREKQERAYLESLTKSFDPDAVEKDGHSSAVKANMPPNNVTSTEAMAVLSTQTETGDSVDHSPATMMQPQPAKEEQGAMVENIQNSQCAVNALDSDEDDKSDSDDEDEKEHISSEESSSDENDDFELL